MEQPVGKMRLTCLPDDILEIVLTALFAPRPGRLQTLCLDDTVFVALVSRRVNAAIRRVFEELVSAFCDGVGIAKPSGRIMLMTNRESIFDAKPGAEGRRFKFVLEWKPASSAVTLSRCAYTARLPQQIKFVLYCPAYQQGLLYTGHAPPVRDSHIWSSGWQAYRASFCSKTLSSWALRNLVKRSPINMIVASCDHCFDRLADFVPSERVTSMLLESAAHYGRVDVLERLFRQHLDRSAREFYGVARLLFFESDVALEENGELSSAMPYYMAFFILPAILGNRVDVLDWVRASTTELFKRQWPQLIRTITRGSSDAECRLAVSYQTTPYAVDYPCGRRGTFDTQMRALSGRQPFGPEWHRSRDFAVAAILATQWGSVDVLEWMYNDVSRDRMFGYAAEREEQERSSASNSLNESKFELRDSHRRATQLALIVCALNGGQFKTGNVRNDKPYQKLGACARWGLSKWRTFTKKGNLGDLCRMLINGNGKDTTPDGFREDGSPCVLFFNSLSQEEPSKLCLLGIVRLWLDQYSTTDHGVRRGKEAIFHTVFSFGDEDHTRWITEETRPGGFLAPHPFRPDDLSVMNTHMPFAASLMHSPVASSVFERTSSLALTQRHAAFFMLTEMGGNGLHRYFAPKGHPTGPTMIDVYSLSNTSWAFHELGQFPLPVHLQKFEGNRALQPMFEHEALATTYNLHPESGTSPWPLGREPSCDINRSYGRMLAARLEAAWECATHPASPDAEFDYNGMLCETDAILQIYVHMNKRYTRDATRSLSQVAAAVLSDFRTRVDLSVDTDASRLAAHVESRLEKIAAEAELSR